MPVTHGAWDPSRPRALMPWDETELLTLVTLRGLSPSPERLALDHAVRIHFSLSPAVKPVFMMMEDFV